MTEKNTSITTSTERRQSKHTFYQDHKPLSWLLIYGVFYMTAFYLLEQRDVSIHLIHCRLDDMIPFCKYFILPYLLWFPFMGLTFVYIGWIQKDTKQMWQLFWHLTIGTTLFLFISWVYPNGQHLRPALYGDDIFTEAIRRLYQTDTPTNILPSLHVYGTVVAAVAILEAPALKEKKWLRVGTILLSLSIIASTVFLKQHSIIDGIVAIMLNTACYFLCYRTDKFLRAVQPWITVPDGCRRIRYRTTK